MSISEKDWFLYVVRRCDNALYTGITVDVPRRFRQHLAGTGAKALRGRSLELVYSVAIGGRSEALRAELRFKALQKSEKEALVRSQVSGANLVKTLGLS